MRVRYLVFLLQAALCLSCGTLRVGRELPAWKAGELDIHAIRTERGECYFYIMPDGTTMLVDCGEIRDRKDSLISHEAGTGRDVIRRQIPSSGRPAHEVAAEYVRHYLPSAAADSLDYMVLTHHHDDHMSGIRGLYRLLPFRTVLDHTDASGRAAEAAKSRKTAAYISFLTSVGLEPETFRPGTQPIRARHNGPAWTLTGLCASGMVWDGEKTVNVYEGGKLSENASSIGFILSYGAFDWFATGDAGDSNSKTCFPAALSIGRQVEAMKVPHHFAWNTLSVRLLECLQPQVLVSESFWSHQPWKEELSHLSEAKRIPGRPRDVFLTSPYIGPVEDNTLTDADLALFKAYGGHVVIRVARGGDKFRVFLTDSSFRILFVSDPYPCNK